MSSLQIQSPQIQVCRLLTDITKRFLREIYYLGRSIVKTLGARYSKDLFQAMNREQSKKMAINNRYAWTTILLTIDKFSIKSILYIRIR
jgi:hypothetical protein